MAEEKKSRKTKMVKTTIEKLEKKKLQEDINFRKFEVILKDEEGELKKLEVAEKLIKIDEMKDRKKDGQEFTNILKVNLLSDILTYCQVDEEGTAIGSETKLKHIFSENEKDLVKGKLFKLINNL